MSKIMELFEKIQTDWEKDCVLDMHNLDRTALGAAKLHQKYLKLFFDIKKYYNKLKVDKAILHNELYEYYTGKGERPFAQKILKKDVPAYIETNNKMVEIGIKFDNALMALDLLKFILDEIKQINWRIKTALDYKRFMAGDT